MWRTAEDSKDGQGEEGGMKFADMEETNEKRVNFEASLDWIELGHTQKES